jgi:hypothetical protein
MYNPQILLLVSTQATKVCVTCGMLCVTSEKVVAND